MVGEDSCPAPDVPCASLGSQLRFWGGGLGNIAPAAERGRWGEDTSGKVAAGKGAAFPTSGSRERCGMQASSFSPFWNTAEAMRKTLTENNLSGKGMGWEKGIT